MGLKWEGKGGEEEEEKDETPQPQQCIVMAAGECTVPVRGYSGALGDCEARPRFKGISFQPRDATCVCLVEKTHNAQTGFIKFVQFVFYVVVSKR